MITGAFFSLIAALLTVIVAPLPVASLGVSASVASWVTSGSGIMSLVNSFAPIREMVTALGLVITIWLPAVVIYKSVNWLYRHIPVLGGGG
jgi:hypothetical protein